MPNLQYEIENLNKRVQELEQKLASPSWIKSESARLAGSKTSEAKSLTSKENGKLGGRPKGTKSGENVRPQSCKYCQRVFYRAGKCSLCDKCQFEFPEKITQHEINIDVT